MVIDGNAAHICLPVFKGKAKALLRHIQDLDGLGHDFRANAVASQNCYLLHGSLHKKSGKERPGASAAGPGMGLQAQRQSSGRLQAPTDRSGMGIQPLQPGQIADMRRIPSQGVPAVVDKRNVLQKGLHAQGRGG